MWAISHQRKNNPYDPNAIALYARIHKIGYIPADTAAKIAPKIDNGTGVSASIDSFYNLDTPYPKIVLKLNVEKPYNPKPSERFVDGNYDYQDEDDEGRHRNTYDEASYYWDAYYNQYKDY